MKVTIIGGEQFEATAASKKMKNNATVFFPRNSLKVLDSLENYAKHKALKADNIKLVLDFLRSSSEEEVQKFAQSKSSHKVIEACLNIAKARKIGDVLDAIHALKVPASMKKTTSDAGDTKEIPENPTLDDLSGHKLKVRSFAGILKAIDAHKRKPHELFNQLLGMNEANYVSTLEKVTFELKPDLVGFYFRTHLGHKGKRYVVVKRDGKFEVYGPTINPSIAKTANLRKIGSGRVKPDNVYSTFAPVLKSVLDDKIIIGRGQRYV